jgi:hypothetical protein
VAVQAGETLDIGSLAVPSGSCPVTQPSDANIALPQDYWDRFGSSL